MDFVSGIGCFSEAILDYCANIENAPYPDITKDRFFGEIYSAYEIMFNVWLQTKEPKVRVLLNFFISVMPRLENWNDLLTMSTSCKHFEDCQSEDQLRFFTK